MYKKKKTARKPKPKSPGKVSSKIHWDKIRKNKKTTKKKK